MAAQEGDWRAGRRGRSSVEQFLHLLESGALSDCTFRVSHPDSPQDTKEFQLHRLVLSKASVVWERMLLPPAGEPHMSEADTGIVHITDIQPHIFHHVLRHVYGDEGSVTSLSYPEVQEVLQVADRYQVPALVSACEARICQGELITPDTVWSALHMVDVLHGLDKLKRACVKVLRSHTKSCLDSPEFLTSPESALELLLSQKALSLTSELFLVCAVVRWARKQVHQGSAESTRSALLPRLLPLLRLATCKTEHLKSIITLSEWLTEEEALALKSGDATSLPTTLSREKPRQILTLDPFFSCPLITLERPVLEKLGPREVTGREMCMFKVSGEIVLHGFTVPSQTKESLEDQISLVGSCDHYMEDLEVTVYKVDGYISYDYTKRHLAKLNTVYEAPTPYNSKIYIPLPSPLQLKSNSVVFQVIFKKLGFYPMDKLSKRVPCDLIGIEFYNMYDHTSKTNHDGNCIESLSFMQVEK